MTRLSRFLGFAVCAALFAQTSVRADQMPVPGGGDSVGGAPTVATLTHSQFSETVYAITINGQSVSDGAALLEDNAGDFYAADDDTKAWRLTPAKDAPVQHNGRAYHALKTYATKIEVRPADQSLNLTVPASVFQATNVAADTAHVLDAHGGRSASLDYEVGVHQSAGQTFYESMLQGYGYLAGGELGTQVEIYGGGGQRAIVQPINTAWIRDVPSRRAQLALGNSTTQGGLMGDSLRVLGITVGTNFSMVPNLIVRPVPQLNGVAQSAGTVNVYANGGLLSTSTVPQGPFSVGAPNLQDGTVNYDVIVKDPSGRAYAVSQSYYADSELLAPGLHQFSYSAGAEALQTGLNQYGPLLAEAHEKIGVTNELSADFTAEYGPLHKVLAGAGVLGVPHVGSFTAGFGWLGAAQGSSSRIISNLGYDFTAARAGVSLYVRQLPNPYSSLGITSNVLNTAGAALWTHLNHRQDMQFSYSSSEGAQLNTHTIMLSTTREFQGGQLGFYAARTTGQYSSSSYGISLSRSVGRNSAVTTSANAQDGRILPSTAFTGMYGRDDNVRVNATVGGIPGRTADLYLDGTGNATEETLDVSSGRGGLGYVDAGIHGGFEFVGGKVFASRMTESPYALVDVGYANIPVYRNNVLIGRTNGRGQLFVPMLSPYIQNTISIDPSTLPVGTTIETDKVVVPIPRTGTIVRFKRESTGAVMFTLIDSNGAPLAPGTPLEGQAVPSGLFVANDGLVYFENPPSGTLAIHAKSKNGGCTAHVAIPKNVESVPNVGKVRCD